MRYNKYRNIKTVVDGIKFDSKREAERYMELKLLEKAGEIKELKLQPKFTLQSKFKYEGKTIREISYIADFQYKEKDNEKDVVEDVKGVKTSVFRIKEKMFLKKYGELYDFRIIE